MSPVVPGGAVQAWGTIGMRYGRGRRTTTPCVLPANSTTIQAMWPNRDETDRLLGEARAGAPGAVDRLLGEFREPLRRVIGLRLDPAIGRRVDASDIVQDVLLEANQRLTEYL